MFTGIIHRVGRIRKRTKRARYLQLEIESRGWRKKINAGDSLSVNGVCLTIAKTNKAAVIVQIIPETLNATNLGLLKKGDKVNLEPSLSAGDSLGGHFVLGHVDGLGKIFKMEREGEYLTLQIQVPKYIIQHLVNKGAIAVEGISLTVQEVQNDSFRVAIIPYTFENTNLRYKAEGDFLNLETDILAKYIEKQLHKSPETHLTEEFLRQQGY